jgi:glycosyltransferase involved in cell wall biosynthesis
VRLRVAMLTDFPRRVGAPSGGVESVAAALALGLGRRDDIDLQVVTSRRDVRRAFSLRLAESVTVHYLPRLARLELPTFFLHERVSLARLLGELRPDVVHAHTHRQAFACGSLGHPYVLTVHGISSLEHRILEPRGLRSRARRVLIRFVERRSFRRAKVIIANSSYVIQQAAHRKSTRITLIPNPVDPLFFVPDNVVPSAGRITWVGCMSRLKAVDVLVRALPIVRRAVPAAHLRLIGPCDDSAYFSEIEELSRRAGPAGSVQLVGPRYGPDLRSEYAAASVFTLPSRQENAPMSIAEAMAVGRPVVASRVGGVADLVTDGVTGLLSAPDDVEGLARSLAQVLADEPRRRQMGRAARTTAESRFAVEPVAACHAEVYRDVDRSLAEIAVARRGAQDQLTVPGGTEGVTER